MLLPFKYYDSTHISIMNCTAYVLMCGGYVVISLYYYSLHFLVPSAVKAHQFFTEESWNTFKQIFETYMFEASKVLL